MKLATLTLAGIRARPVILPLRRPVVARIATITEWPIILIDLTTAEGVVGRSYLEPYIPKAMAYLVAALNDLGELLKGQPLAPVELYERARKSLHFVGYEGLSMIAVSGLDMAAWDALARAMEVPLCVLLGGTPGPVPAYNSNGLWLIDPAAAAEQALELRDEGGFEALKLRLGRERLADDLAAIAAVRDAVGDEISLMVDFTQGLHLGEALQRCHAIDDHLRQVAKPQRVRAVLWIVLQEAGDVREHQYWMSRLGQGRHLRAPLHLRLDRAGGKPVREQETNDQAGQQQHLSKSGLTQPAAHPVVGPVAEGDRVRREQRSGSMSRQKGSAGSRILSTSIGFMAMRSQLAFS